MTTIAWGMTTVGFIGLLALCMRAPERDDLALKLTLGALFVALSGVALLIYATPYEPIPQRVEHLAPIAGAPLVLRIEAAHDVFVRRLP
jgi:hypothetical protein